MSGAVAVIRRNVANSDLGTYARLAAFEASLTVDLKCLGRRVLAEHRSHHRQAGGVDRSHGPGKKLIFGLGGAGLCILRVNRAGSAAGEDGEEQTR